MKILVIFLLFTSVILPQKKANKTLLHTGRAGVDTVASQYTFADVTNAELNSYYEGYIIVRNCDSTKFWTNGTDSLKLGALSTYDVSEVWAHRNDTVYVGNVASDEYSTATNKTLYSSGGKSDEFRVTTKAIPTYTITSNVTNGTITPSGVTVVDSLESQSYTFSGDAGYDFDSLVVDDVQVNDSTSSYTFANVGANHTIHAFYSSQPPVLALRISDIDFGSVDSSDVNNSFSFYIINSSGGLGLTVTDFTGLSSPYSDDVGEPFVIPANDSVLATITMDRNKSAGTYVDSIFITSDGGDDTVTVTGIITVPPPTHNVRYVSTVSDGDSSADSWANKKRWSLFNWAAVSGGDTVYIDGGTDSLTYPSIQLGTLGWIPPNHRLQTYTSQVVITKGKDATHNGKVIIQNADAWSTNYTLGLITVSHVTLDGLTLNTVRTVDDSLQQKEIISLGTGHDIVINNCEIISNGLGTCIYALYDTNMTITNNTITVQYNNYKSDADNIFVNYGGGGHTITGNIMSNGKVNNKYHADFIQYGGGGEGSDSRPLTTIANNIMTAPYMDSKLMAGINANLVKSNRFLIYNNIISLRTLSNSGIVFYVGNAAKKSSFRLFNNTIVTRNWTQSTIANIDTVVIQNNIFVSDTALAQPNLLFSDGIASITYKDIDYNYYYKTNGAAIDTNATTQISLADWQALGYDTHGGYGAITLPDRYGTDISDYETTTGMELGTDLSSTFTTDINDTTRPILTNWDMGAVESRIPTITVEGDTNEVIVTNTQSGIGDSLRVYRGTLTDPTTWVFSMAPNESYHDSSLTPDTVYYYRAKTLTGSTLSNYSSVVSDTVMLGGPPDSATNVVAVGSNLSATITWTETGSPDSVAIFGGTSTNPTTPLDTIAGGLLTFTYSSITDDGYWYFRLKTKKSGLWSAYSLEDTATVDSTNLVPDSASTFATSGVGYWSALTATKTWVSADSTMSLVSTAASGQFGCYRANIGLAALKYRVTFRAKSSNATYTMFKTGFGTYTIILNPSLKTTWQNYEGTITGSTGPPIYVNGATVGAELIIDNIKIARCP